MALKSPHRRLYSAYIHSVIALILSTSLMAVWCSGISSPASVACCATLWISEPQLVATLPMRGPEKRFSNIQHTGHAHRLSTAEGDKVTTSDRRDLPFRPDVELSDVSLMPVRMTAAIFRMVASTVSPINGQRSGSAAVTPCEASNANASAASRAFGLSSGSDASTLRAAATRPRGSVSSPA